MSTKKNLKKNKKRVLVTIVLRVVNMYFCFPHLESVLLCFCIKS